MREISIPASAHMVELQLDLQGDRRDRYSAGLTTAGGRKTWELSDAAPQPASAGASLSFLAPASVLIPGQYELTVTAGGQIIDCYYFKIVPR